MNNVGNSCYMNAALQCLLSTTELTHFFLRGFYLREINVDNPLGWQGKVAESFKLLVDQTHSHSETWEPRRNHFGVAINSVEPSLFKRAIAGLNGGMFRGFMQQDSQELLGAVLDGIHEDLNRVKKKPYVENVVGDGTNDTAIAQEAWNRYKMRNDSFVVDTFQGQMRSRVTCTECRNMSVSFDPSMYLSVAFKQSISQSSIRVVVKFESPKSVRPSDQINFEELPEGFHFDCDVKVATNASDTFGSLVKRFEERSSGHRFIAVTFSIPPSGICMFDMFVMASEKLPIDKTYANYVILEVNDIVAEGWIHADRLAIDFAGLSQRCAAALATHQVKGQHADEAEDVECSSDSEYDKSHDPAPSSLDIGLLPEHEAGLYALVSVHLIASLDFCMRARVLHCTSTRLSCLRHKNVLCNHDVFFCRSI